MITMPVAKQLPPWLWQMVRGGKYRLPPLEDGQMSQYRTRYAARYDAGTTIGLTKPRYNRMESQVPATHPSFMDPAARIGDVLRHALLLTAPKASLPGLSLSVTYAPAFAEQAPVGGDFFDAFALPGDGGEVALVVGDMTGKGLDAAVHIAAVKYALRAFLRELRQGHQPCPGSTLSRLNEFVCYAQALDDWEPDTFVSVALVILNTTNGTGRFALAASEVPLILPHSSIRTTSDETSLRHGLPLGAVAGEEYTVSPLHLPEGATLLLLTDGLTEARCPARTELGGIELLGYEGIARIAEMVSMTGGDLSDAGRAVMEEVRAYSGGYLRDDACLLLARRNGPPRE